MKTLKKIVSFTAFVLPIIFLFSCTSREINENKSSEISTEDAITYNEKIVGLHTEVDIAFANLLISLEEESYDEIMLRKETALGSIKDARTKIYELGDFDGNDEFKNELLKILEHYESIINTDLNSIIILHKNLEDLTESDMVQYTKFYSQAMNKYDSAFNNFAIYQTNFAEKWNFDLE